MAKTETAEVKAEKLHEQIDKALRDEKDAAYVKKVRKDLGEHLAEGTDRCKNCKNEVVGMLKTPSYFDPRQGIQVPAVWEVGCVICPPYYAKSDKDFAKPGKLNGTKGKFVRRSYSARGTSIEQARDNWNAGNFVEDTKFGLNVPIHEHVKLELDPEPEPEKANS